MQAAYRALQGRDMSGGTFNEVLQQARSAPTTAGSQVDLLGNTETLNLMVEKGKLADKIRTELGRDKGCWPTSARTLTAWREPATRSTLLAAKKQLMRLGW